MQISMSKYSLLDSFASSFEKKIHSDRSCQWGSRLTFEEDFRYSLPIVKWKLNKKNFFFYPIIDCTKLTLLRIERTLHHLFFIFFLYVFSSNAMAIADKWKIYRYAWFLSLYYSRSVFVIEITRYQMNKAMIKTLSIRDGASRLCSARR